MTHSAVGRIVEDPARRPKATVRCSMRKQVVFAKHAEVLACTAEGPAVSRAFFGVRLGGGNPTYPLRDFALDLLG